MAALAACVEVVVVSDLGWTRSLPRSAKAFLFPTAAVLSVRGFELRMSRSGKHLACAVWFGVAERRLSCQFTGGGALTMLSNFCQRFSRLCENCGSGFSWKPRSVNKRKRLRRILGNYRTCSGSSEWKAECNEPLGSPAQNLSGLVNIQNWRVGLMSALA